MTEWLAQVFSVRRYLLVKATLFLIFSIACAFAVNLPMMVLIPAQIVRALGQPLILTPLSSILTASIEAKQIGFASAIYNMARNLGGSVGISILGTLLLLRERFHSNRLVDDVSLSNPITLDRIDQLTQFFTNQGADPVAAHNQAIAQIANIVCREANVLSFNDCFLFMGFILFAGVLLVLLLKKVKPTSGAVGH